ncbi:hypothetical protein MAR_000004 [Mya arenaria]|uniref:Uncharacterized protein n=1 Tax=Mya arenaria TaxID=6604 RepID=A0ABY7FB28_MYAAR|nr:hypothetical protein MAR_000004 [Mya arenaria]
MTCRSSCGAGGKSVWTGKSIPSLVYHPQSLPLVHLVVHTEGGVFTNAIQAGCRVTTTGRMHEEDVNAHSGIQLLLENFDVPHTWIFRALLWLRFEEEEVEGIEVGMVDEDYAQICFITNENNVTTEYRYVDELLLVCVFYDELIFLYCNRHVLIKSHGWSSHSNCSSLEERTLTTRLIEDPTEADDIQHTRASSMNLSVDALVFITLCLIVTACAASTSSSPTTEQVTTATPTTTANVTGTTTFTSTNENSTTSPTTTTPTTTPTTTTPTTTTTTASDQTDTTASTSTETKTSTPPSTTAQAVETSNASDTKSTSITTTPDLSSTTTNIDETSTPADTDTTSASEATAELTTTENASQGPVVQRQKMKKPYEGIEAVAGVSISLICLVMIGLAVFTARLEAGTAKMVDSKTATKTKNNTVPKQTFQKMDEQSAAKL